MAEALVAVIVVAEVIALIVVLAVVLVKNKEGRREDERF